MLSTHTVQLTQDEWDKAKWAMKSLLAQMTKIPKSVHKDILTINEQIFAPTSMSNKLNSLSPDELGSMMDEIQLESKQSDIVLSNVAVMCVYSFSPNSKHIIKKPKT